MKNFEVIVGLILIMIGIAIGFFVEPVVGIGVVLIGSMVSAGEAVDFFAGEEES